MQSIKVYVNIISSKYMYMCENNKISHNHIHSYYVISIINAFCHLYSTFKSSYLQAMYVLGSSEQFILSYSNFLAKFLASKGFIIAIFIN